MALERNFSYHTNLERGVSRGFGGFVTPGGDPTYRVLDNFDGAFSTNLYSHTPDIDLSAAGWGRSGTNSIQLQGDGTAKGISSGAHSYIIDAGIADVTCELDITSVDTATTGKGIWVRVGQGGTWNTSITALNNSWLVCVTSPALATPFLKIYQWTGAYTERASVDLTAEGPLTNLPLIIKAWSDAANVYGQVTVNGGNTYNTSYASALTAGTFVGLRTVGNDINRTFSAYTL